ncbi:hypothetical protein [Mycoplasma buteonis]|uniref:hypothetical protein n=1 Tax=Mycoplasma buteonis TaxID=171280 RepID=UPI0005678B7F|nr:hypothetical protein [Mycoplasma buteonis]
MKTQQKVKNPLKWYKLSLILTAVILGILGVIFSNNIFQINLFPSNQTSGKAPIVYYGRIILNLIYTLIILSLGLTLAFKNKISALTVQNLIFLSGVFVTFTWIPVTVVENVSDQKQEIHYEWLWYKGDVFVVFTIYAFSYFLSFKLITNRNIYLIKQWFRKKHISGK